MSDDVPIEISDAERIARAVMSPAHFNEKKRKLKRAAFKPAPGTNLLSVIRTDYLSVEECKARAKAAQNANATYLGFARILAGDVRSCGPQIVDAREDFSGHAHVVHAIAVPPKGEVLAPDEQIKFDATLNCLVEKVKFFIDPDPGDATWSGDDLRS